METDIELCLGEIRAIKLSRQYLAELREMSASQRRRLRTIELELATHASRIEGLNKPSLGALVRELLGRKEQLLEMHRQHYLNLALEYNELQLSLERAAFEKEVLERKISREQEIVSKLKDALKARDALLSTPALRDLQVITQQIDRKQAVIREIEEAIDEGLRLSKLFASAIRFAGKQAGASYKVTKEKDMLSRHEISVIEKYQQHMVGIQHSMLKFEAEVSDVYQSMKTFKVVSKISDHFLSEYRMNLINDIHRYMDLGNSQVFLRYHHSVVKNFLKTLRDDLRQLRSQLKDLEAREASIVADL